MHQTPSELQLLELRDKLVAVTAFATSIGVCVEVTKKPVQPFAMGNTRYSYSVWPMRNKAEP